MLEAFSDLFPIVPRDTYLSPSEIHESNYRMRYSYRLPFNNIIGGCVFTFISASPGDRTTIIHRRILCTFRRAWSWLDPIRILIIG